MKIKGNFLITLFIFVIGFAFLTPNIANADSGGLGVGLRVFPSGDESDNSGLTGNTKLWFVVKQGESQSRELLLTGSATVDQKISLSLVQLARVDGQPSITDISSELTPWANFSQNNFVLNKNQSKQIKFTISPPQDAPSSAYEAYLIVTAGGLQKNSIDGDTTQAVIKNSARVAQPVFVGVGSFEEFKIDFELKNVVDIHNSEGKFLRVFISNRGKTPIAPNGQVQMKNMDFEQATIGPLMFYSSTIPPKSEAYVDVALPQEVNPGKWRVLVRATQGNITVTKEFEKDLAFRLGIDWFSWLIKAISLLLGGFLSLWIYRTLRSDRIHRKDTEEVRALQIADETKALIAQLEAQKTALEKQVAQTSQRSQTRKAAIKKEPAKGRAKKAATKKPPKKGS